MRKSRAVASADYDDVADDGAHSPHKQKKPQRSLLIDAVFPDRELPAANKSSRDLGAVLVAEARIPMEFWGAGWVFKAVEDILWRCITKDSKEIFPATLRKVQKTHPAYLTREIGNYSVEICPLTSRRHGTPRIPAGKQLKPTDFQWEQTSYLVTRAASRLPRNNGIFPVLPKFLGILPPDELER